MNVMCIHPSQLAAQSGIVERRESEDVVIRQHLRDLARLRRVRDRIHREYARPLDLDAPPETQVMAPQLA